MSAINYIENALRDLLDRQSRPAFRITPKSVQGKRGRRARRQAFYERQRTSRALRRVMWELPIDLSEMTRAHLDVLTHGFGAVRVSEDGLQRVAPSTMFFGFDGQEVPPPDGSPSDADKDATGLWWNIEINDELKRLIGTQGDRQ